MKAHRLKMRVSATLFLASAAVLLQSSTAGANAIRARRHLTRRNLDASGNIFGPTDAALRHVKNFADSAYHPHKHGNPDGDSDDGYAIGHGYIDGLSNNGRGKPKSSKTPKGSYSHSGGGTGVSAMAMKEAHSRPSGSKEGSYSHSGGGGTGVSAMAMKEVHSSGSKRGKAGKACVSRAAKVSAYIFRFVDLAWLFLWFFATQFS